MFDFVTGTRTAFGAAFVDAAWRGDVCQRIHCRAIFASSFYLHLYIHEWNSIRQSDVKIITNRKTDGLFYIATNTAAP